jgi:hypothetical protein
VACSHQNALGREEYLREWYAKNKDGKVKAYRTTHAEKLRKQTTEWRKAVGYDKAWRAANRGKVQIYNKASWDRLRSDPIAYAAYLERQRKRYAANPQSLKENARRYYTMNKEKANAANKRWAADNPERALEIKRRYARNNPDKVLANVRRRQLRLRNAVPTWLTPKQHREIEAMYSLARQITDETGIPHEVDHIVPLKGKTVCGLHVPWNLQVIPMRKNRSKGVQHSD